VDASFTTQITLVTNNLPQIRFDFMTTGSLNWFVLGQFFLLFYQCNVGGLCTSWILIELIPVVCTIHKETFSFSSPTWSQILHTQINRIQMRVLDWNLFYSLTVLLANDLMRLFLRCSLKNAIATQVLLFFE
jgi:hypothetical protein